MPRLSHLHLSIWTALVPTFPFDESLFIPQGTNQKRSHYHAFYDLLKTEWITSSFGLLSYFVRICITYLTLCFAGLSPYLFPHKSMQGLYLVYSSVRHITSVQPCLLNSTEHRHAWVWRARGEAKIKDSLEKRYEGWRRQRGHFQRVSGDSRKQSVTKTGVRTTDLQLEESVGSSTKWHWEADLGNQWERPLDLTCERS